MENQTEQPKTLHAAILAVMDDVQYLQKDDEVGSGSSKYKAITDTKVRQTLRASMIKNGLTIAPVKIERTVNIDRWEVEYYDTYAKEMKTKIKQQVLIDALITYKVTHIATGESIEIQSIGVGIDPQDKSPGKAMTYAQKYALLNLFMIPTGNDADAVHSDDIETPQVETKPKVKKKITSDEGWNRVVQTVAKDPDKNLQYALDTFELSDAQVTTLKSLKKPK